MMELALNLAVLQMYFMVADKVNLTPLVIILLSMFVLNSILMAVIDE